MRRTILLTATLLIALSATGKSQKFSYVYMQAGNARTISSGSLDRILSIIRQYKCTCLWAELDGRRYLIQDAAVLREINKVRAPLEALEPQLEQLHSRMHPVERRAERLEDQIDALADGEAETAANEDRLESLERELRVVTRELERYEREEERLDRQQDALDEKIEVAIRKIVERSIRDGVAERLR